jgi:hypothetical protein
VTIPVNPRRFTTFGATLCFTLFLSGDEASELVGEQTTRAVAARDGASPLRGRVRVEYLRPSRSSWWSLALPVARRMGLGHAGSGTWSALLVATLMVGITLACARVILRELR